MSQKLLIKKPESFCEFYYKKPGADKHSTHYCPGCGHGNMHKLIAEALADFGVTERTLIVNPVGCSVFAYYYFDCGNVQVPHGRAPAVGTALSRCNPDSVVICYQGDGDLAAIGTNELIHAANRGENMTIFFVNNAIYGMTGGQMAPTTLIGQKTMTTPYGRTVKNEGYPIRVCELLSSLEAPVYLERVALTDAKHIAKARQAVRKAIKNQIDKKGFSLVEALAPCPTGWKVAPQDAAKWIEDNMFPYFKLGVYKDVADTREPIVRDENILEPDMVLEKLGLNIDKNDGEHVKPSVLPKYANPSIKISGFGGQGVLLLGEVLAKASMKTGYNVSWLPSYGPEMRGGTAFCSVIVQDTKIGSPMAVYPNVLIAMNRPSLEKFEKDILPGGIILYNSSLIEIKPERDDLEVVSVPVTEIADELGNVKISNMVALGAYIGYTGLLDRNEVIKSLSDTIRRKDLFEINEKAIDRGIEYVKEHYPRS
jgi:2-oxoisovalerate ferredoxin oxidoreductase beta subunit